MQKLTAFCCVLAFLFGAAAGTFAGHYHGVAVTLEDVITGQAERLEALK